MNERFPSDKSSFSKGGYDVKGQSDKRWATHDLSHYYHAVAVQSGHCIMYTKFYRNFAFTILTLKYPYILAIWLYI